MAGEWETVTPAPAASPDGWETVTGTSPQVQPQPMPAAKTPSRSRYGLQDFTPKVPAEVAAAAGSGLAGSVLGGYAGLWGSILPGEEGQGAQWSQAVQEALTYQPRTQAAKDILNVAALPGKAVSYVSEKVGERGAEVSPLLGAVGKTSVEALPLLLGARAMTKPKPALTPKQQQVAAARDAGFRMTPEEMGAGPASRVSASISGEARLARSLSKKNQALVNEKIASDLGLPKGSTLDLETLRQIRNQAGKQYETVRGAGRVVTDDAYRGDLAKIAEKYNTSAKDFPEMAAQTGADEVGTIVRNLNKEVFDANGAVDLIRLMRDKADGYYSSGNKLLGQSWRGGAEAIEGMLERHLGATGQISAMQSFRAAREMIAKSYQAQNALVGADINPRAYATALKKNKPLTGGGKEVGEFASRFERSMQRPTNQGTGATMWDAVPAAAGYLGMGFPGIAAFFARPAMRALLASRPMQYLMDPRTRTSSAAQQAVGASQVIPRQEERP